MSDSKAGPVSLGETLETVKKNLSTAIEESGAEIFVSDMPVGARPTLLRWCTCFRIWSQTH